MQRRFGSNVLGGYFNSFRKFYVFENDIDAFLFGGLKVTISVSSLLLSAILNTALPFPVTSKPICNGRTVNNDRLKQG